MTKYRYTARNVEGELVSGTVEAIGLDNAWIHLEHQGLEVLAVEPSEDRPQRLRSEEAEELTQQVARVSAARLPLTAGLRAAAEETASPRTAEALRWIASQLEQGRTLEYVLTESKGMLPRYIAGLTLAAANTSSLGEALVELVDQQRTARQMRRGISAAFAYPMTVLGLAIVLLGFIFVFVTGPIKEMIEEFQLVLPMMTQVLFWWRDTGISLLLGCVAGLSAALLVFRLAAGKARYLRFLATVPLLGPLFHWAGVAEWLGLMSILTRHQIPLPEATASGGWRLARRECRPGFLAAGRGRGAGRRSAPVAAGHSAVAGVDGAPVARG